MSLVCPKCKATIKAFSIKKHFNCPSCSTKLTTDIKGPVIAGATIWTIIEFIVAEILYSHFGRVWESQVLKILISTAIGLPIMFLLIDKFGSLKIDKSK